MSMFTGTISPFRTNSDQKTQETNTNPSDSQAGKAALVSIENLAAQDRTGRSSPLLTDRVQFMDLDQDPMVIEERDPAEIVQMLVDEGWTRREIAELNHCLGNELFFKVLSQQAIGNRSEMVLKGLPLHCITELLEEFRSQKNEQEALVSNIELETDPSLGGPFGFLTPQESDANRNQYFPNGIEGLTPNLREWLESNGWSKDEFDRLGDRTGDDFVIELIDIALSLRDYDLILSLPTDHNDQIFSGIDRSIANLDELIGWIEQRIS